MAKIMDKYIIAPFKIAYDRIHHFLFINDNTSENSDRELYITEEERLFKQMGMLKRTFIFFDEPTHIIDGIYLGSAYNAAKQGNIDKYNFGMIINVTRELSKYCNDENVIYHNFPIYDNNKDSITDYLDESYDKINTFLKDDNNKKILIHCFMGASRSASVMIHYLMKKYSMTFEAAIKFVRSKRQTVNLTKKLANDLKNK